MSSLEPSRQTPQRIRPRVPLGEENAQPQQASTEHDGENSSCKNTVKMTDRREFSFLESQHGKGEVKIRATQASNSVNNEYFKSLVDSKKDKDAWGSINDTVSRL